jgi:hypothetical protein
MLTDIKVLPLKRIAVAVAILATLLAAAACKKQQSDTEAIRAGIMQHLSGVGGLNLGAMQMDIRSVSINGSQARAEVEFRPKTGSPPGTGMQVAYNLEKRDGAWVVSKTQAAGGAIQHPDPNQNPHQNQNVHPGSLPNFSDVLNPGGGASQATPPPAKPQTSAQDQSPAKKPR